MTGIRAFREAILTSNALDESALDYGSYAARRTRYEIEWAFFENTAYRNIHGWAVKFKADYGLYKYTRNVYNPAYRLADFWRTHIMGGTLDPLAGDGLSTPSALPILTPNLALRPALAQLWRDSNWQTNKNLLALHGSLFGDAFIQPVDDVLRQKVYLKIIHPGLVKSVTLDPFGNVKAYVIEEQRPDPTDASGQRTATYTEVVDRAGAEVTFQTLLNNRPYAWNGQAAEWSEPYGFAPLVKIQHANLGLDWGWSELHPALSKVREVDDIASKIGDQIRKSVDAPLLLTGVSQPATPPKAGGAQPRLSAPEPGREEITVLYGDIGADVKFLLAPLSISESLQHLKGLLEEIERDYPELQLDIWRANADVSGRALRIARQRTEIKVQERRANYDAGLVHAQQMAIAMGGLRGYNGYAGFGLDSFAAGALDHAIARRPVFALDPLDDLELQKAFWEAAGQAQAVGGPTALTQFLKEHGRDSVSD